MEELNKKLKLLKLKEVNNNTLTLEATVPTGLEYVAMNEISDKVSISDYTTHVSGRIYWTIPAKDYCKVSLLRSVDNVNLFVDFLTDLNFTEDKEHDLSEVFSVLERIDLKKSMAVWASLLNFKGNLSPTRAEHDAARIKQDRVLKKLQTMELFDRSEEELHHDILRYRVTCERSGLKQSFTSNEAAYRFGGEINDRYNWIVALSDFHANILLRISGNSAMVLLKLTKKSMHNRCLVSFGPTTLRPTIAFSMLYLANIQPGDHVVDPLCGGGSIPIECLHGFPEAIITCGDIHHKAVLRTTINLNYQRLRTRHADLFLWDSTKLPFRNHSIDVIVSDLPFGRRSGCKKNNAHLYVKIMEEFGRVLCLGTGRLVVLSYDSPHLFKALRFKDPMSVWYIKNNLTVNVGALKCSLIVARRKKHNPFVGPKPALK